MLEGKIKANPFLKVQSGKITVCIVHYQVGEEIECTTFQIKYKLSSFEKFASLISHFFSVKREGANFTTESGNFSAKESLEESRDCISIQVDHSSRLIRGHIYIT